MKKRQSLKRCVLLLTSLVIAVPAIAGNAVKPALNGITLPEKYKDWRVISVSHRTDNKTMRVIVGNDIAIKAARENNINPWPQGSILGKLGTGNRSRSIRPCRIHDQRPC